MLVNMKGILADAKEGRYGIGLFNAVTEDMARAIIETAEELCAPVIVGTAEVLLPRMSLDAVAGYLIPMAKEAKVPVCVHYDHGLTEAKCFEALDLGFTSVMYDCSTDAYEDNVSKVAAMAAACHQAGATIEGELGHVGDNEGAGKLLNPSDYFTDPAMAKDFSDRTGIDALAVAVGNAHGEYKFPPKLDSDRISDIAAITGLPLVLHGGSGLSDDDFRTAVQRGICKINIFTDLDRASSGGLEAMKAVVREKMQLFGSRIG